jgi:hypothetical protein
MKWLVFLLSVILTAASVEAQRNPSALEAKRSKYHSNQSAPSAEPAEVTVIPPSKEISTAGINAPLKIISKPRVRWPDQSRGTVCMQGSVLLKVEFLANGSIGRAAIVRGLTHGATENAIEAARKIVFSPRIVNGERVDSILTVEFPFSIY